MTKKSCEKSASNTKSILPPRTPKSSVEVQVAKRINADHAIHSNQKHEPNSYIHSRKDWSIQVDWSAANIWLYNLETRAQELQDQSGKQNRVTALVTTVWAKI